MTHLNKEKLSQFFNSLQTDGIEAINRALPQMHPNSDLYTEKVKSLLLAVGMVSIIMMVSSPYGWMYACYPRPFILPILILNGIIEYNPPIPEWGIHYLTLLIYTYFAKIGLEIMEESGIDKAVHKIGYIFFLTVAVFYVPFELVYITLYDIFHNLPVYNYFAIWAYGWWNNNILEMGVIMGDVVVPIMCIIGMYVLKKDLNDNGVKTKFTFNKISATLLSLYIITTVCWVALPVFTEVQGFGTDWFPQTVYVEYGYFADYDIPIPPSGEEYGIVKELWYHNDTIKILNHSSKLFSVAFMFYTFIPRRVEYESKTKAVIHS